MSSESSNNSDAKPVCSLSLCGKEADWRVDFFGRTDYYCQKHRPGIPETLMTKIKNY